MESNFSNNQLDGENLTVDAYFRVLGNLGHHEVCVDLVLTIVLISDALNIKPGFGQTANFL